MPGIELTEEQVRLQYSMKLFTEEGIHAGFRGFRQE